MKLQNKKKKTEKKKLKYLRAHQVLSIALQQLLMLFDELSCHVLFESFVGQPPRPSRIQAINVGRIVSWVSFASWGFVKKQQQK